MRPLETAQENVRRLAENSSINLPHVKQCCSTNKSAISVCDNCKIEYCSETCKYQAYHTYHQTLCLGENRKNPNHPFNLLMDVWKQIHLPPETTTIFLIIKLIATMKQVHKFYSNALNFRVSKVLKIKVARSKRFIEKII